MPWLQFQNEGLTSTIEVEVDVTSPRGTYERLGPVYRTYSGRIRSQVKAIKRVWEGSTPPLTFDDAEALVALVGTGMAFLSGVWPGGTYHVDIEITGDQPIKDARELTTDALRIISFRATEDVAGV